MHGFSRPSPEIKSLRKKCQANSLRTDRVFRVLHPITDLRVPSLPMFLPRRADCYRFGRQSPVNLRSELVPAADNVEISVK